MKNIHSSLGISNITDDMFEIPLSLDDNYRIGLLDADLLDNGSRHPNLALMKLSTYYKLLDYDVELIMDYQDYDNYDLIMISRVFTFTKIPNFIFKKRVILGGTGFTLENYNTVDLPDTVEHSIPDYHLYDEFVRRKLQNGESKTKWKDYLDFSIGFITRGCFRKCEFCVNKKYDKAFKHANVSEFIDLSRKRIYLWDDNFLAYNNWEEELDTLILTGKYFQFKQGLDIRLMTDKIAKKLASCKYYGDFIFAFDHIKDAELIENKLRIWRKYCQKGTKLYLFCAYDSQDEKDIEIIFKRIEILFRNKCLPYVMRYESYKNSEFKDVYTNITRWANQPRIIKKMSFREFCEREQELKKDQRKLASSYRTMVEFEDKYPDIAAAYFDLKFSNF